MKKYLMIAAIACLAACGSDDKQAEVDEKDGPLEQSKNPAAFNQQFGTMLDSYYHLKDALVLSNDTLATAWAIQLTGFADSLQVSLLEADSMIVMTAKDFVDNISAEAKGLVGEKDLEAKRKSFQMISDNMYNLLRTVRYDRAKVYYQYCPMAFNDEGANWLSQTDDIKNPYFGKKMLSCGEVKDTINFTGN